MHRRRGLKEVRQRAEQAEPRHRHGHGIGRSGGSARRRRVRDEPGRERRHELDQAARKPGHHQPRQIRRRSTQRDPQQVRRLHVPHRQRPVEHPGLVRQRGGTIRRHPDAALADRIEFPVAPPPSRQERHGLAVFGAECQHRVAVAAPPGALGPEPYAPGAHARRIENVKEADRSTGGIRARRDLEIDSFTASDRPQGVRQRRVLDTGIPVNGQIIDIEEPLPRSSLDRAAARGPRALEIRIIDRGQSAVQALQGEGNRVKGCERRGQDALPCQCLGRPARECRLVGQDEPACPRQRYHRLVWAARLDDVRRVDQVHDEAGAGRRFGYPYDAALYGQRTGSRRPSQTGSGQRSRTRKAARKTRKCVRNRGQPGVGLFRQLRRIGVGQHGGRQAFQNGTR